MRSSSPSSGRRFAGRFVVSPEGYYGPQWDDKNATARYLVFTHGFKGERLTFRAIGLPLTKLRETVETLTADGLDFSDRFAFGAQMLIATLPAGKEVGISGDV